MSEDDIFEEFKAAARFIKTIQVNDIKLLIEYKNEEKQDFLFKNLKKASIITTDEGPFLDDVFWLLMFKSIVMIPQGIPGEDKLLPRMQQLPGFDNTAVVRAMSCSQNDAFHVWETN